MSTSLNIVQASKNLVFFKVSTTLMHIYFISFTVMHVMILVMSSVLYMYMLLHPPFFLSLTRSLIDDPEFACSDLGSEAPQDQEYFEHVAELQG